MFRQRDHAGSRLDALPPPPPPPLVASPLLRGNHPKPESASDRRTSPAAAARDLLADELEAQAHTSGSRFLGIAASVLVGLERYPRHCQAGHRDSLASKGLPAVLESDLETRPRPEAIRSLGTEPKRTAFRSPWQNGVAERWVGTWKREVIDHIIVISEDHLRRILREYVSYYNADRVHTVIRDAPLRRAIEARPSPGAKVAGLSRVGGLHHRNGWKEAA